MQNTVNVYGLRNTHGFGILEFLGGEAEFHKAAEAYPVPRQRSHAHQATGNSLECGLFKRCGRWS